MKGDFTRSLFKKENHYHDVRMQQGRVQLDADWNEQLDITAHRMEAETIDVVGACGGPLHAVGFELVPKGADLEIGKGHYYVDGIFCENEEAVRASKQPDLPENAPFVIENGSMVTTPSGPGIYLAYLDVWRRHITALEAPQIREDALGGPDTTTRTKTVWQVKLVRIGGVAMQANCIDALTPWDELTTASDIKLAAQAKPGDTSTNPCILAPGAGYRRLENQLYRVEIHRADSTGRATFKWSRDNGSIVARWTAQDKDKLSLSSVGRDKVLNFAGGQWVELTDDDRELQGLPGVLVKIDDVDGNDIIIDSRTAIPSGIIDIKTFGTNPKARRWDSEGELTTKTIWVDLEDGIRVKFSNIKATYRTGDYWMIPARTSTSDVEWPTEINAGGNETPVEQTPHGIQRCYCRLAILKFDSGAWSDVVDCRRLFPPVTELISLYYAGGDGQEAMPGETLAQPICAGVTRGRWPVKGARVEFEITKGGGGLLDSGDNPLPSPAVVMSDQNGHAHCWWKLDNTTHSQRVKATLRDPAGGVVHLPVHFNANLSIAGHVAYDPAGCSKWKDSSKIKTVKDAIDELCMREHKGGCAVTIGKDGGEYPDLVTALASARIQKAGEICLCFLPGDHLIEKDVQEKKNSIKIVGCGAKIRMTADILSFAANRIVLADIGLHVENDGGQVVLTGQIIDVEGCEFVRSADAQGPPLVQIQYPGKVKTELRWKANKMEAWWIETIPEKVSDFFMPVADIEYSAEARDRLVKLSKMNPYEKKEEFERALEMIAKDIEKLPVASRVAWFERRSTRRINKLQQQQKAAIESLFEVIKSERFTAKLKLKLRENLEAVFKAFHIFYYADAIALTRGVGGWLEDNVINGYVSLHYTDAKSSYLNWTTGKSDEEITKINSNKGKWVKGVMEDKDYILVESMSLNLRGNDFYAVRSNAPFIMKIIENILKSGEGVLKDLDLAYKSLTATDNTFRSNGNSFVSETVTMQGNKFVGGTQKWSVVANVLGYIGIFTGNSAPQPSMLAIVECILKQDPLEAANFLRIENFS